VFQKEATHKLPVLRLQRDVLYQYVTCADWLIGFACDIGGSIFMVLALSLAPVSLVEPVAGSGLAILALFCHHYLHEKLHVKQWVGVGFAMVGVVGMGLTAARSISRISTRSVLPLLLFIVGAQVVLEVCYRRSTRDGSLEVVSGIQGGMFFGLSAISTRLGQVVSQQPGIRHGSLRLLCAGGGIACSLLLSPAGFFFQTRGFKRGRAAIVVTFTTIASISTGLLVGLTVLSEPVPRNQAAFAAWCASIGSVVISVLCLMAGGAAADRTSPALAAYQKTLIDGSDREQFLPIIVIDNTDRVPRLRPEDSQEA